MAKRTTAKAAKPANPDTETDFGKYRNAFRSNFGLADVAKRLWPQKTAIQLALRADVEIRTAELWLAGKTTISGEALSNLLRSDVGFEFLTALMADGERPAWWADITRQKRISDLRKAQEEQRREIERLEREAAE